MTPAILLTAPVAAFKGRPPYLSGKGRGIVTPLLERAGLCEFVTGRSPVRSVRRALQPPALPREPRHCDACRCLLRQGQRHPQATRKDQTADHRTSALAAPQARRVISIPRRGRCSANLRADLSQMCWRRILGSVLQLDLRHDDPRRTWNLVDGGVARSSECLVRFVEHVAG